MHANASYEPEHDRVHDLLRLRALPLIDDAPTWLAHAFAAAPFAVVRRGEAPPGFIAVGFRGGGRSQRFGTYIARASVLSATSPEDLACRSPSAERQTLGAFAALWSIAASACLSPLVWGPTGSAGFELATSQPVVTPESDLDLLIRMPSPLSRSCARALRNRLQSIERATGVRIDAQLDTPAGGVALNEWIEDKPRVLARSARGPRLVDNPWEAAAVDPRDEVRP